MEYEALKIITSSQTLNGVVNSLMLPKKNYLMQLLNDLRISSIPLIYDSSRQEKMFDGV